MTEHNTSLLLKRFAENNDQRAFTQLVENHVNVAYSAALAYLGNEDLAHDACQLTFCALAKKARGLSPAVQLSGWVYSTARNIARKIGRAEARRLQREQRYFEDMKTQHANEPDWTALTPTIHDALERLNPIEREAILLRFFQRKSLAETGEALGISADAARMRLNRALERLNQRLARRGVATSAAALATALPSKILAVAPANAASSISTAVLSGTATVGIATLTGATLALMKIKTLIISTVLAATALTGATVYYATQGENETPPAPREGTPRENPTPRERAPDSVGTTTAQGASAAAPRREESNPADEAAAPEALSIQFRGSSYSFLIDPKYIARAEEQFRTLELREPSSLEDALKRVRVKTDSIHPSNIMRPRLALDPETTEQFNAILELYPELEALRVARAYMEEEQNLHGFLLDNRDLAICSLALELMGEDMELTAEQKAFTEKVEEWGDELTQEWSAPTRQRAWYENQEIIEQLSEVLSPAQCEELLVYRDEKALRAKEQATYHRSLDIAERLGLNEADRGALFDYLQDHPEATDEDIADQLSPELHALLLHP